MKIGFIKRKEEMLIEKIKNEICMINSMYLLNIIKFKNLILLIFINFKIMKKFIYKLFDKFY